MDPIACDGQRVLVVGAHPDDPEFGCAGTVAKWVRQGKSVHYLLLSSGDKGSHDPQLRPGEVAALREQEQRKAAAVLGVASLTFLRQPDGLLEANMAMRQQVCAQIRRIRPHILVTIDPWRRYQLHPDHRAAGLVALDAAWAAREWGIFPEQLADGEEPWRISEAYLFWTDAADHWEDISDTIGARILALAEHKSQVGDRIALIEEHIREGTRQTGEPHGMAYAEAFKQFTRF